MCHINFLILIPHAKGKSHLVFYNQLTLLKSGYSSSDFLKFLTTHAKQVFDDLIINSLLLQKAHVGEVQASVWDKETLQQCESAGIEIL